MSISFKELKAKILSKEIDTVLVSLSDMQGRLVGKRVTGKAFIDYVYKETHMCDYLYTVDMDMFTVPGYKSSSWETGYGDMTVIPDLKTIKIANWLNKTAIVICDCLDHSGKKPLIHSTRQILKDVLAKADKMGFQSMVGSELEFFLFEKSFKEMQEDGFRELKPISAYNEDYHILQTTKEEHIMRPVRNCLWDAGIPVENSKGEAETGQEELNIKYANALNTAEYHTIAKHAVKEIAWSKGHAVTFLPKWHHDKVGSSSHVHQSLWKGGKNAFYDPNDKLGMSLLMKQYMAGLLNYTSDITFFLAPYVNSYKRFAKGTFAPTRIIWSVDNRTAGFRLCGAGTKSVRIECRIGGSDMNPYLAIAAQIAAGLAGIENKLELDEPAKGDVYQGDTKMIPENLRDAKLALAQSKMLKSAFGEDVVKHYCRAAEVELEEFDRVVTDWEIARGFERA